MTCALTTETSIHPTRGATASASDKASEYQQAASVFKTRQRTAGHAPASPDSLSLSVTSSSPSEMAADCAPGYLQMPEAAMEKTHVVDDMDLLGEIIRPEMLQDESMELVATKKATLVTVVPTVDHDASCSSEVEEEEDDDDDVEEDDEEEELDEELDMDDMSVEDEEDETDSTASSAHRKSVPHRAESAMDGLPGVVLKIGAMESEDVEVVRNIQDFATYKTPGERAEAAIRCLPHRRHRDLRRQLVSHQYYTPIASALAPARIAAFCRGGSMSFHSYDGESPANEEWFSWFYPTVTDTGFWSPLNEKPSFMEEEGLKSSAVVSKVNAKKKRIMNINSKKAKSKARGGSDKSCCSCGTSQTPIWREVKESWGEGWENILLCNACGLQWRMSSMHCDSCNYVPRASEKRSKSCTHCETGTFLSTKSTLIQ